MSLGATESMDSTLIRGKGLISSSPDSAITYYNDLTFDEQDSVNLHFKWSYLGLSYYRIGQFEKSAKSFAEALVFAYNDSLKAKSYNSLGAVYTRMSQFDEALENYFSSLSLLLVDRQDSVGIAKVYNNISVLYQKNEDYKKSIEYALEAVEIYISIADSSYLASTYNNIGNSYLAASELDSAEYYFSSSLAIRKVLGDELSIAQSLNNLGLLWERREQYEKAMDFYRRALVLRK
jgi:tetratricopeptide (TPR) repeat protein